MYQAIILWKAGKIIYNQVKTFKLGRTFIRGHDCM